MKTWIFGDPHAFHTNLTRGVSKWDDKSRCRDFDTAEEMTEVVASNINSLVKEEDQIICVGDWSFGSVENILKFRKMIKSGHVGLIRGNHDRAPDTRLSSFVQFIFTLKGTIRVASPVSSINGLNSEIRVEICFSFFF